MHKHFLSALRANASARVLAVAFGVPFALAAHGAQAGALPGHGHYVSGQGSINKANRSLTVKQSSTTGIINWKSFSAGKHDAVTFDNGGGATLNRVTGGNLSTIAGSLHATGSLYLMNSAGVIISGTGRVVTGGNFVATSGTVSNTAFDDGRREFLHTHTAVINRGHITAGGNAKLVGHTVTDSGTISASDVKLNGREGLTISGSITAQQSSGAGGNVLAMGHTIVIGAHGEIDASAASAHLKGGTIDILAERTATVAGTLKAKGGEHGAGGLIDTSGKHVHIADSARISTLAKHGAAGTWLIDPQDFTVAASGGDITGATLSTELGGGNIDIQSSTGATAGSGDINIDQAVSWSTTSTLTLDAFHSINVDAAITLYNAGGVVLTTDDGGSGGGYFFNGGNIAFTNVVSNNTQGSLVINGVSYTLVNSVSQLATDVTAGSSGNYALANNYDATADGTYAASPVTKTFGGTFEGLGNSIANLTVNDSTVGDNVGLFADMGGTTRDLVLTNVSITGGAYANVGGLAGESGGTIKATSVSGSVSGGNTGYVGGLVGHALGTISNVSATADIMVGNGGYAGGLLGWIGGSVTGSDATGSVTATASGYAGGLVGYIHGSGSISDSYATGVVSGGYGDGGLVAEQNTGSISDSYATGTVSGQSAGGLVGDQDGGSITDSYATGAVSGGTVGGLIGDVSESTSASVSDSYATGAVTGTVDAGGFVGDNRATISDSYATGAVSSTLEAGGFVGDNLGGSITAAYALGNVSGGASTAVGGFVGINELGAAIDQAFSLGTVQGPSRPGGFAGGDGSTGGITNAYWDTDTSGASQDYAASGTAGITSANLRSALPTGFDPSHWSITADVTFPYITAMFSSAPIAISGTLYDSPTTLTAQSGQNVYLYNAGNMLARTQTYADGSYYTLLAPSAVPSTGIIAEGGGAYAFADGLTATAATDVNIYEGSTLNLVTGESTLSALGQNLSAAAGNQFGGSFTTVAQAANLLAADNLIIATQGAFTFDQAMTVADSHTLSLNVSGTLNIDADIAAGNSTVVTLNGNGLNFDGAQLSFSGTGNSVDLEGVLGFYNGGRVFFDSTSNALKVDDNTYTLVDSVSALATAANATPNGYFALADNYDASNDAIWTASPVTAQFLGAFEGLGNTINGLRINDTSGSDNVGLFSNLEGAVSNLTLTNVQITGGDSANVGALAGFAGAAGYPGGIANVHVTGIVEGGADSSVGGIAGNMGFSNGSIANASMSGSVLGGVDSTVGGIAGATKSLGTISQSYSTAIVSGGQGTIVGGLVGDNEGSISESYAAGVVSANDGTSIDESEVGGLVGHNGGTIDDSYSLTYIANQSGHSNTDFGGLVGVDGESASVSDSFWDTQTSGIASASQGAGDTPNTAGITGITSTALQSSLPGSFSSSDWSILAGSSYPYLTSQFAQGDTPEVISGTGGSDLSDLSLEVLSAGSSVGQMNSFADGSFYLLVAPDTVADTGVAVYDTNHTNTIAFSDSATTGLALANQTLEIETSDTSAATLGANIGATLGTTFTNGGPAETTLSGVLGDLESQLVINAGGAFNVDRAITNTDITITSGGKLTISQALSASEAATLNATGTISETGAGAISTGFLTGSSTGAVTLNAANVITDLGGFTTANGAFSLTDAGILTVYDAVNAGTGNLTLTTTGAGDDLVIDHALTGHTVTLTSAGTITGNSSGIISASTLTGSSVGATTLTAANVVTDLGAFDTHDGTFSLTDAHTLAVYGTLDTGTATLKLDTTGSGHSIAIDGKVEGATVDLISASAISESSAGDIDATKLEGSSVSKAEMTSAKNTITDLGVFTSGSTFELTDDHDLTVDGTVDAGAHTAKLTTTGSGHDLAIDAKLEGATVELISAATISESSAGDIDATKLEGSSVSKAEMTSAENTITDLGTFTSGSTFELTDDHDLTVDGTVNAGAHTVKLTTTGSGHDLAIDAKLEGATVELVSAATISESSAGDIDAATLEGSSVGTAEMTSAKNTITDLGTFTSGSVFELTDDRDLTVNGKVDAGVHTVTLTTTGSGHDLAIDAKIEAGTADLISAATISESSAGDIDAKTLTGSAHGAVELTSAKNTVTDLGTFSIGGNNAFELTDDHALTVDGKVNAGTGTLDLTTIGSGHNLVIASAITGGTVNLVTTGEATETSKGAIAAKLLNVTAITGIDLTSKANTIKTLGTHKTKKGPNKVTL